MQDVVREGTGQGLKNWLPPEIAAAGKTGTTDEQRDAWFAGFTGDRVAVVWLGYDDNRAARLSGAGAALPIWGELIAALNPEPLEMPRPERHRERADRPRLRPARRLLAAAARASCPSRRARRPASAPPAPPRSASPSRK